MIDVHFPEKKHITISNAILDAANISPDDHLDIRCQEGMIMLVKIEESNDSQSLLDFAGCTQGLYGKNTAERQAYLANERSSWER